MGHLSRSSDTSHTRNTHAQRCDLVFVPPGCTGLVQSADLFSIAIGIFNQLEQRVQGETAY
jgi:hypothetical protein